MSRSRLAAALLCCLLSSAPFEALEAQYVVARSFVAESDERAIAADTSVRTRNRRTLQNATWATGFGVVAFGVIWVLPEDISMWPREDRELDHLLDSFRSPPVWDNDPWYWNYAIHPVLGAWSYLAERNYGHSAWRGFLFSTATSLGWEYGVEAWVEHPSAQDLIITSTVGSVLGEMSYRATKRMARDGFGRWERVALAVINPVWLAQNGFSAEMPGR